jgi:hypothetical protein
LAIFASSPQIAMLIKRKLLHFSRRLVTLLILAFSILTKLVFVVGDATLFIPAFLLFLVPTIINAKENVRL